MAKMQPRDPRTDEELMRDFSGSRDGRIFEELFDRYGVRAVALARAVLGSRSAAEDAAQQAFLRLATTTSYQYPRPFASWFLSIVRNLAIDEAQRRAQQRKVEERLLEGPPRDGPKGALDQLAGAEDRSHLREILAQAPPEAQEAILLRIEMDLSFVQMAEVLGTTEEAARKRFVRAIQSLREALVRSGRKDEESG
jgi:RNA polymerase sigma-70 factor, ECF subfamily